MRKVLFKKWIPREFTKLEVSPGRFIEVYKAETACWELDFTHEGLFHQWGVSNTEAESGFGNFSIALIELPDGTIEEVLPSNIKFID